MSPWPQCLSWWPHIISEKVCGSKNNDSYTSTVFKWSWGGGWWVITTTGTYHNHLQSQSNSENPKNSKKFYSHTFSDIMYILSEILCTYFLRYYVHTFYRYYVSKITWQYASMIDDRRNSHNQQKRKLHHHPRTSALCKMIWAYEVVRNLILEINLSVHCALCNDFCACHLPKCRIGCISAICYVCLTYSYIIYIYLFWNTKPSYMTIQYKDEYN